MEPQHLQADCPEHGIRDLTFACIHVAEAIDSGEKVGFFCLAAKENLPPIAWCDACENWLLQYSKKWGHALLVEHVESVRQKLLQHDDETHDAFMAVADFKPLCADCFDLARKVV